MRRLMPCLVLAFAFTATGSAFAQTTYWLGRKETQGTLVYDVRVPDFFVPFVKTQNARGFVKTVNGQRRTFYRQLFTWHNSGSSPRTSGQIRIDVGAGELQQSWPSSNGFQAAENRRFVDELYQLVDTPGDWVSIEVFVLESNGPNSPNLRLSRSFVLEGTIYELGRAEMRSLPGESAPYEKCPQYIAHANGNTIDVVFQDVAGKNVFLNSIRMNNDAGTLQKWQAVPSLGLLAGFVRNSQNQWYVATAQRHTGGDQDKQMKIYWFRNGPQQSPGTLWSRSVKSPLHGGTSRLALDEQSNRLLAVFNQSPTHSHYVLLDANRPNQTTRPHKTLWHHNTDQRAIFDGKDFIVMENRDHDVGLTLMKVGPQERSPERNGAWQEKVRSVYTTTNWGNDTHIELGQVQPGLDGGYLVLFSSERDWDFKYDGFAPHWNAATNNNPMPPNHGGPRDLAMVHVVGDFDKKDANWRNAEGNFFSQSPGIVDTTPLSDGVGPGKTVTYRTANDGFDWPNYGGTKELEKLGRKQGVSWNQTTRKLVTGGVGWLTRYGEPFERQRKLAIDGQPFVTVMRPKLVKVTATVYVALWEEHDCTTKSNGSKWYPSSLKYRDTKALKITCPNPIGPASRFRRSPSRCPASPGCTGTTTFSPGAAGRPGSPATPPTTS